jgi:membrane associated rhomboid family serine protease
MAGNSRTSVSVSKPLEKKFLYSLTPALLASSLMIAVKFLEWTTSSSFAFLGLRPREIKGLAGIVLFPFLHGDGVHLISNLFPFIFLSTLIYNLVPTIFWKVYGFTFILSGFWTWCFARSGLVIGASGWVYALLGFLLVAGFARVGRKMMIIAGGLAFLYGGMVYGLVPVQSHISWEGHLMGLFAGALAAFYWKDELKQADTDARPKPLSDTHETEPPYPYWLFPTPHFIDSQRNIIPLEYLVWENGKPRLKTEEEIAQENQSETDPPENHTQEAKRKGFTDGTWTYHIS